MCGFAGVIAWEDKYRTSREVLARMSAAVAHRGPDGEGTWFNHEGEVTAERPQAALAFRRLAIIDLDPRANQPMTDGQGRWIVFNGEIYNYRELRRELSSLDPPYEWRTQGDTEVLLRSYAQWGEKCVEHLNGMFAFAVWDEGKKELYLARDRMGQKPLYCALLHHPIGEHGECEGATRAIAFASELSALRTVPWIPSTINPRGIARYLKWGYHFTSGTMYEAIHTLPPARWTRKSGIDRPASGTYFDALHAEGETPRNDDCAARRTRELVNSSVARQLVSDVPLGCFLSGGMDSSVIAAAMKATGQRTLTFSIGFDDARYDETRFAAEVARHLGTEHRAFVVRPDAATDLPKLAAAFGEPFGDSSALPTHYLARETRQFVKVALSGDGGDELFGGYDRYRALHWSERIARLPAASSVAMAVGQSIQHTHPKSLRSRMKRFLEGLPLDPADRYAQYTRLFSFELCAELLPEAASPRGPASHHFWSMSFNRLRARYGDSPRAARALDIQTYLPGDLLTKVDRASMLHALEVRSPFMDHELVQFAAGLTTDQLIKGGPKRMLREAFAKDLPEFVFKRRKMGFAVPIGEWMRGELRPMLHDHLFAGDSFASAHFNKKVVERLVAEHQEERVDHSQRLYALLMLELWWRGEKRVMSGER